MRTKLSDRRASETRKITFAVESGGEMSVLITVGFDEEGEAKEVFCADFKAGTTLHSIVMDACVLFSRLLQHGDTPAELFASMCRPPSLIGAIAAAVSDSKGHRRSSGSPAESPKGGPVMGPAAPAEVLP